MLRSAQAKVHAWYLTRTAPIVRSHQPQQSGRSAARSGARSGRFEPGFEIAQSMGIALLGLIVAAAFATALEALGADIITNIRDQLGLGAGE